MFLDNMHNHIHGLSDQMCNVMTKFKKRGGVHLGIVSNIKEGISCIYSITVQ